MKNAVVIRHVSFENLGSLAPSLEEYGYHIQYIETGFDSLKKLDPTKPDLIIILGGPIGAYDEKNYPFIQDELVLIEKRLAADLPTLGICLGAQLIARALGARVYPGLQGKEIGWFPLSLSLGGRQSNLLQSLEDAAEVLHWHGDTFDLPLGSTRLASSDRYENQAFTYGKNIFALQFHLEVTPLNLERWFIGHACEISLTPGVSLAELRQQTQIYGSRLQHQAIQCWKQWLQTI